MLAAIIKMYFAIGIICIIGVQIMVFEAKRQGRKWDYIVNATGIRWLLLYIWYVTINAITWPQFVYRFAKLWIEDQKELADEAANSER